MNRLVSRIGVRTASVALLAVGVAGGVYLGPGRHAEPQATKGVSQTAEVPMLADADEMQLLKSRQAEHAAARAARTEVQDAAARKAAGEAKAAAGKAHKLEKAAIAKKAEEKEKAEQEKKAKEQEKESGSSSSSSSSTPVNVPASCGEYSGNKAIGCALLLDAGFGLNQMDCLDKLWTRESHWSTSAHNSSSGAHGIPQAVPGNKMAAYGSDWRTSAKTQIKWGLSYIKGRYDTPCGAWAQSEAEGWY